MITLGGIYLLMGILVAVWLASAHKPPYTVTTAQWLLAVAIWPVLVVLFPAALYQAVKRKLKEPK